MCFFTLSAQQNKSYFSSTDGPCQMADLQVMTPGSNSSYLVMLSSLTPGIQDSMEGEERG